MRKFALITAVILLAAVFLYPQDYKGKGRLLGAVLDEQGAPLEGVRVKLFYPRAQGGFEVMSDREGKWVAAWLRAGTWNLDFEKIGYAPKKITVEVQEWNKNPEVVINLKKVVGLVITDEMKDLLTKGNILFDEKKYDEAMAVYNEILQKFPDAYIIHKNVGNCYFAQEKYDLAEAAYQKILEKDPGNADAMILIGNTWANRGDAAKALEWYQRVDIEKIDDPIVLYNVGTSLYNSGKYEDALKYYKKAVEIQKDFTDALYQLGLAYLTLGNNAESIATFEAYLKVDPDSPRSEQVKGFLEFLRKK